MAPESDHRIASLLHRVTRLPQAPLRDAIAELPADERQRLEHLAGEILDDIAAIGGDEHRARRSDPRVSGRRRRPG